MHVAEAGRGGSPPAENPVSTTRWKCSRQWGHRPQGGSPDRFDDPYLGGTASIVIGLILAVVAVLLAYEGKGLWLVESADMQAIASIRALAEADPAVKRLMPPLTMQWAHTTCCSICRCNYQGLSAVKFEAAVKRLETAIRRQHPDIKRILTEAGSLSAGAHQPGGSQRAWDDGGKAHTSPARSPLAGDTLS